MYVNREKLAKMSKGHRLCFKGNNSLPSWIAQDVPDLERQLLNPVSVKGYDICAEELHMEKTTFYYDQDDDGVIKVISNTKALVGRRKPRKQVVGTVEVI